MKRKIRTLTSIALCLVMLFSIQTTAHAAGKKAIPLKTFAITQTSRTVNEGQSFGLCVKYAPANTTVNRKITWTSSNTKVATVNYCGSVVAKKAGTAIITAKMGGKSASCKVTVKSTKPVTVSAWNGYSKVNELRKSQKKTALTKDTNLEKLALIRAKEIATKYSHTRPNGKSGPDIIAGNKYKGECLAAGKDTGALAVADWASSRSHRSSLLNSNYKKMGMAGYRVKGYTYWVILFSS